LQPEHLAASDREQRTVSLWKPLLIHAVIAFWAMVTVPADINVLALMSAKGEQLRYWIEGANDIAGRCVLIKTGKVDVLRQRLASYYGLDLSALPETAAEVGPLPLDEHIQRRQWDHLRDLGDKWANAAASGEPFLLGKTAPSTGMSSLFTLFTYFLASELIVACLSCRSRTRLCTCPLAKGHRVLNGAPRKIGCSFECGDKPDRV